MAPEPVSEVPEDRLGLNNCWNICWFIGCVLGVCVACCTVGQVAAALLQLVFASPPSECGSTWFLWLLGAALRMLHISLRLNLEPPTKRGSGKGRGVRREAGGIATKSFVAATAAAAEANFRVIKWHSQSTKAPPIVLWRLQVERHRDAAQSRLSLWLTLPAPSAAASRQVKLQRRQANAHGFNGPGATGCNCCSGATLGQKKQKKSYGKYDKLGANFIYAPHSTRVVASLSPSRFSKPSLFMHLSLLAV